MSDFNRYYPKDTDLRFTMLTREQETELFTKARNGDADSREFLIKNHLLFAARFARKMVRGKLPDDDVVSAANFAVMRAFDKFDHTLGNRFTSYLKLFIKGEISGLWRNLPTVKMSPQMILEAKGSTEGRKPVHSDGKNLVALEDPHGEAEHVEHVSHLQKLLEESKDSLNSHEKEIMRKVYEDQKSFAEIGRENGVTREAIRATHNRALVKLQKSMKAKGVEHTR